MRIKIHTKMTKSSNKNQTQI